MEWLKTINFIIALLFTVCYFYQYVYIVVGLFRKHKSYPAVKPGRRYAVLIAARNEEQVIGYLLDSIQKQSYPAELIDTYVVADNCTDGTAALAEQKGAFVYCRHNTEKVGKGYALEFLIEHIHEKVGTEYYDAFFVIDADNLLTEDFVLQMDRCCAAGNKIATSYRNSKNYGTNWITSGYALWFLREARYLNNPRSLLRTSCAVSGTGFMVHKDVINRQGGWQHFLLTEDIEFTVDSVLHGEKIAYCGEAVLYDEQPVTFRQSWRQRLRWSRGFLQVIFRYGFGLIRGIFTGGGFACTDMLLTIAPAFVISTLSVLANGVGMIYTCICDATQIPVVLTEIGKLSVAAYGLLFLAGAVTMITEWKNIRCSVPRKILSLFTFPLFMFTYLPIGIESLFVRPGWKPITHSEGKTLDEVCDGNS